jgi:hypothetical protein
MKDAPLREALFLLAGMAVLAIPLYLVTADEKSPTTTANLVESQPPAKGIRSDVEIESSGELQWLELARASDGEVVGRFDGPSRYGDFECQLPEGGQGLIITAKWTDTSTRNAVRIELWPDHREIRSQTFWGQGELQTLWEVTLDE